MKLLHDLKKNQNQLAKDYMDFRSTHKDSDDTKTYDFFEYFYFIFKKYNFYSFFVCLRPGTDKLSRSKDDLMTRYDLQYVSERLDRNDLAIANVIQKVLFSITMKLHFLLKFIFKILIRLINYSCFWK